MSDAKASDADIFDFNICSQCLQPFSRAGARGARHAIPCGHVFCEGCVRRVEAEQKSGKPVCRRAGCEQELVPVSKFAISWTALRAVRIDSNYVGVFGDQGNVGDRQPPTCSECGPDPDTGKPHLATHHCKTCGGGVYCCADVARLHPRLKATRGHVVVPLANAAAPGAGEPVWDLCPRHKLTFLVVEARQHRLMCSECLVETRDDILTETFDEAIAALDRESASASAVELAMQKDKLAEPILSAAELRGKVVQWRAQEIARIRAWEEREIKHIQAVAAETTQLVDRECAHRIQVGASLITQRMGLRASLEELDYALTDLPKDPAARLGKKRTVYAERKRLCDLLAGITLAGGKIAVPSARAILSCAELPNLSQALDTKAADSGSGLASAVLAAAKATLTKARTPRSLEAAPAEAADEKLQALKAQIQRGASSRKDACEFPVIPKLNAAKPLRQIPMTALPTAFVGIDDDTIVVAFGGKLFQVWDLSAGDIVREFDAKGHDCGWIFNLSGGRIVVGWSRPAQITGVMQWVLSVFDVNTGNLLQELECPGVNLSAWGVAFMEGHLLALCEERTRNSAGQEQVCLRVFSQDPRGKLVRKTAFYTPSPIECILAWSTPSTVALFHGAGRQIGIWDWREARQVATLNAFDGRILGRAPGGKLVAVDAAGAIRVGLLANLAAGTPPVVANAGGGVFSVVAGQDDETFVTAEYAGSIKLWRNGRCECTVTAPFGARSLTVVGRRLVAIGWQVNSLLVAEE